MVMSRTTPIGFEGGEKGPRLSPATTAGIIASAALHIGLVAYLYQQRFATAEPEPPPIEIGYVRPREIPLPPPPPPEQSSPAAEPPKSSRIVARETPSVLPDLLPPTPLPSFDTGPSANTDGPPTTGLVGTGDPGPTVVTDAPAAAAPPAPPGPKVITRPKWIQQPTAEQVARFYPQRALEREQEGMAMLKCTVTAAGRIAGCSVIGQTPPSAGFGKAALQLAQYFQMSPEMQDGEPVEGGSVRVPVRFRLGD